MKGKEIMEERDMELRQETAHGRDMEVLEQLVDENEAALNEARDTIQKLVAEAYFLDLDIDMQEFIIDFLEI